jgi:hypothetical protein
MFCIAMLDYQIYQWVYNGITDINLDRFLAIYIHHSLISFVLFFGGLDGLCHGLPLPKVQLPGGQRLPFAMPTQDVVETEPVVRERCSTGDRDFTWDGWNMSWGSGGGYGRVGYG